MATTVLRTNVYRNTNKKESLWDKFMNLSKAERPSIICGLLSMNVSANVYPLYKALTE